MEFQQFIELLVRIAIREHPKITVAEAMVKLKLTIIPEGLEESKEEDTTTSERTCESS